MGVVGKFYTSGSNYRGELIARFIDKVAEMSSDEMDALAVELEREPTNEYDEFAVKVIVDCKFVGYIPQRMSQMYSECLVNDVKFNCRVSGVGYSGLEIEAQSDGIDVIEKDGDRYITNAPSDAELKSTGCAVAIVVVLVLAIIIFLITS